MATQDKEIPIPIQNFNQGGLADSKWSGVKYSLYRFIGWDPHSAPGLLRVAQKMAKHSGVTVTEFCKARLASTNGRNYWGSISSGKIWEMAADGTWTLVYTVAPSSGTAYILELREYQGYIYIITQSRIHRIKSSLALGASDWTTNIALNWAEMNLDQTIGGTGATVYSLTTGVNEGATHKQTFTQGDKLLLESVRVKIVTKGTGDYTLVVHDASNNLIASKVIANASLAVGLNYFAFSSPVLLTEGAVYHVHVYSSVADGTLDTSTNNDLEAAQMTFFTTSDPDFHPSYELNLVMYIGDKHYVHQINGDVFTANALDINIPLRVRSLGKMGVDLLIGTYVSDNVTKTQVYRWNSYSDSFTVSDVIDEVGVNAFLEADNFVYAHCGYSGNLYYYDGEKLNLYKKIPGDYSPTKKSIVDATSVGNLEGQILFGVSNVLGNPSDLGVYRIARNSMIYPYIMDIPYPISERASGEFVLSNIEIGGILVAGADVYAAWKRYTTVTMTIASPGVITYVSHGLSDGAAIVFTSTGSLPTGITSGTIYFAKSITADTIHIYDTAAHAISGGATGRVDTSVSQSGVHTASVVGIDKLDWSNKLNGAFFETRVITVKREEFANFSKFIASYALLPTSTAIAIAYSKNYAAYVDTGAIVDAMHNTVYSDKGAEATTLQVRITETASGNTAPEIESAAAFIR